MKLPFTLVAFVILCVLPIYAQQAPCAIGAAMVMVNWTQGDRLQIVGVASNSPASEAGLMSGQIVLSIDGVPTSGLKMADCVRRIQGEAGTKVVLVIGDRRHDWTNSVTLVRRIVPEDPLSYDASSFEIPEQLIPKTISVTTNQLVQVLGTNGVVTVIQFIYIGPTNASYRWRARAKVGGAQSIGSGSVYENYEVHTNAYGLHQMISRGSQDDLYVKAGNVRLKWSHGGATYVWLYHYPSQETQEKVNILNSSVFDSDLW